MLPSGDQMCHICRKSGYQMAAMVYTESPMLMYSVEYIELAG